MLELLNVKKVYTTKAGDTAALDGVSIKFAKSGMVFITGKSGSGKTTMLNVIGGLDGIDEGEIIIEGKKFSEFKTADYDSYRNTFVGFIFQEYNLLGEYSVEKNIGMANELQGRKTNKEELENLLKMVDMEGLGKRSPSQLSGGQKQRVAIARALIKNPSIIMADEPTGALDSATGVQVIEALKELSKTKLVIVVSHDLELAEKYADRIVRLVDGKIVEDVTLNDVEVEGNVYDGEQEISVKSGSDLTKIETEKLVDAIKRKKKVNVIEKISVKERKVTGDIEIQKPEKPVKFINSKMKIKSSMELGVKSLFVKPFRLAVTILLSVVAFAVFGLFDTVASFSNQKVITDMLRNAGYKEVAIHATINDDNYSNVSLKMSQSYIDGINEQTGYKFKGVYDIDDSERVADMDSRDNFNEQVTINSISRTKNPAGKDYYVTNLSGMIEFKNSEVNSQTGVIDEGGFNYKMLDLTDSHYPVFDPENPRSIQVAISSYIAESILFWLSANNTTLLEQQEILTMQDLIGVKFKISSMPNRIYQITAVVDCGKLPSKYNELKEVKSTQETKALAKDLTTYLNSGAYLYMFVGEGYTNHQLTSKKRVVTYVDNYTENTEYMGSVIDGTERTGLYLRQNDMSFRFYNVKDFKADNTIMFDDLRSGTVSEPTLKKDETLIHINNLNVLFYNEMQRFNYGDAPSDLKSKVDDLPNKIKEAQESTDIEIKRSLLNQVIRTIDEMSLFQNGKTSGVFDKDGNGVVDDKTLTVSVKKGGYPYQEKVLKVKGVYFDVDLDFTVGRHYAENWGAIVLSEQGLKDFGITLEQGIYSKAISINNATYFSTKTLGKLMSKEQGINLNWHKNTVLESVESSKQFVDQFFQLFLYVSIVLAFFAVFMLFNYISASIISKRQSIGVLRALGADGKNIFQMFITESLIISLINGILASIIAYFACGLVNKYVLEVMNLTINFAIYEFRQVALIFVASVVTGILSSLLPIIRIAKEKPVDLIRKL